MIEFAKRIGHCGIYGSIRTDFGVELAFDDDCSPHVVLGENGPEWKDEGKLQFNELSSSDFEVWLLESAPSAFARFQWYLDGKKCDEVFPLLERYLERG